MYKPCDIEIYFKGVFPGPFKVQGDILGHSEDTVTVRFRLPGWRTSSIWKVPIEGGPIMDGTSVHVELNFSFTGEPTVDNEAVWVQ